jgi:hypothetical protein
MSCFGLGQFFAAPRRAALYHPQHNSHRRAFFSRRDADAYDAGHAAFAADHDCPEGPSPAWQGWMDAQGEAVMATVEAS